MRGKKALLLVFVMVLFTVLLTACDGGPATNGEGDGEVVINLGRSWEEKSWDPASFTMPMDVYLAPMVYEPLVELHMDGSITPLLAEDWDVSEDGLTYTFKLREGVQWHHGYGEFTAADAKFSIERHGDPEVNSINIENINLENIASIETPDDYTLIITLDKIDVDFMTRLALYYGYMLSEAAYEDGGLDKMKLFPVGTGPYQYDQGTPGTKTEIVRFEDYWGEATGNIDRICATIITDTNTMYSALESGEIDSFASYDKDKTNKYVNMGFNNDPLPMRYCLYLGMNMQLEPFDDPLVREALFCAIDPQVFIEDLYYNTEELSGSYIPAEAKYALKDYLKPNYDPERTRALLAEAGYPDGIDITLWSVNDAISPSPATLAHSQLEEAGFNCELQLIEAGVFFDMCRAGEAPLWLLYNDTPPIADHTMTRYMSNNYPGNNWCGFQDEEYDALVEKGIKAETEEDKAHYFAEAQKRMISFNTLYPITTYHNDYISNSKLSGYTIGPDACPRYHNATLAE